MWQNAVIAEPTIQLRLEDQSVVQVEARTEEMVRLVVRLDQWPTKHEPRPNQGLVADIRRDRGAKHPVNHPCEVALLNRNPEEMREGAIPEEMWRQGEGL